MNLSKVINFKKITYTLFGIVFLTSGVFINLIQFLLYIFLKPINGSLFRVCNYYLSYSVYSQIVFVEQYWANIKVNLTFKKGDFENNFGKENAFLVMNHSYEVDWMIGWILCENCRILGNVITFAKKSLQYLPTLGYSWKISGSIFVERNWEKDQKVFESKIRDLTLHENPFWLLLAAEGTRFTKEKHEVSKAFAREHGLPELKYHLTPRTRGFTSSLPILRRKMAAIYNVNVCIKPGDVSPTLTNILLGKSISANFLVERYPIKELPESERDLAAWLHLLYKKKDDSIHRYLTTGTWHDLPEAKQYETLVLPRRIFPAVNFACWSAGVLASLGFFIMRLIFTGNLFSIATAAGIIYSFVYCLDKLIGETQINKASSYGKTRN